MRYKAFILAVCTLCFLAEYAMTPRVMMHAYAQAAVAAHGGAGCCHETDGEARCPKPAKDCKTTADCCLNCPMCYFMLLPSSADPLVINDQLPEYSVWHASYLYRYQASCWKPPNAA